MTAFIGAPIARKEDVRLLSGRGAYVDDFHIEGMLHAAIVRSPVAHGRIRHLDTSEAEALPGVVGVFTARDCAGHLKPIRIRVAGLPRFEEFLQMPLAIEKVRYVGEPIAVVVAETAYLAEDALSLISVAFDELAPILTWEQAAEGKEFIHEVCGHQSHGQFHRPWKRRSAHSAQRIIRAESVLAFSVTRQCPWKHAVCWPTGMRATKTMTVYGATKIPFFNRKISCRYA